MAIFGIQIAVDPGNAKTQIDGVTGALDKLENKGKSAPAAASKALHEMASEAGTTTTTMDAFNRMIGASSNALDAEARMLAKIQGPLDRYNSDLLSANALLEKGLITTNQYADALTRMNQQLERASPRSMAQAVTANGTQYGPAFDPAKAGAGSGGGGDSGGIGGLAGIFGVGIGVSSFVAAGKAIRDMRDEYTDLENRVRKFADASGGVEETLRQQLDLSVAMRANLSDSIGLYDRVTQSTRNLYLTQKQQLEITESLGLMAKEANVPLSEAEGIMKKFTIAADTGTFSMRLFKDVNQNMPQMLQALADHFGYTIKEFERLAIAGKIAPRDIALAIQESLPGAQAKIESYGKTSKERMQELAVSMANAAQEHQKWVNSLNDSFAPMMKAIDQFNELNNKTHMIADGIASMNESFKLTKLALAGLFNDKLRHDLNDYNNGIGALALKLAALQNEKDKALALPNMGGRDAGFFNNLDEQIAKTQNELTIAQNSGSAATLKRMEADRAYRVEVAQLTKDMHNQALGADGMKAAHEALIEVEKKHEAQLKKLESEQEKLADRLVKQAEAFKHSLSALDLAAPRIGLQLYNEELERLIKNYHNADFDKVFASLQLDLSKQTARTGGRSGTSPLAGLGAPSYASDTFLAGDTGTDSQILSLDKDLKLMEQAATAASKYTNEVEALHMALLGSNVPLDAQTKMFRDLRDRYNDMRTPDEQFAKGQQDIADKLHAQIYNAQEAERALRKLREATGRGTASDGLTSFTESLKKNAEDSKVALDFLNAGFTSFNDGIMNLIESKGSIEAWGESFISTMAKIAEQVLATKLLLALLPGLGGDVAAAIPSGAGMYMPGHANGATISGNGVDTMFYPMMINPNERITVHSQQESARMARGDGGNQQPLVVHVHNGPQDRRALPMPMSRGEIHVMIKDEVAKATRR